MNALGRDREVSATPRWNFPLSADRLRAHGLILALCLWSVYLWNMSAPGLRDRAGNLKGTDFLHFYTLGCIALEHQSSALYDLRAQERIARWHVPEAAGSFYLPLYPPQVSMAFAPLAKLPYGWALTLWLALSAAIYAGCCFAVWRTCDHLRNHAGRRSGRLVLILALAFPAFWNLVLWGQTSAVALAFFTLAFLALRARHEFLAGLALGCLIFKPQLGLAAAILFLCRTRWAVLAGAAVSASFELLAGALYYGFEPLRVWVRALLAAPRQLPLFEPRLYQTHSLRTFWMMLIPWPWASSALYIVSGIAVCLLLIACWHERLSLSLRYSGLLFATALIAPHLTVYDLVILAPAFLLVADWIAGHPEYLHRMRLSWMVYLAFVLPLTGPFARWTHLQLSVPVMAMVLWAIWNCGRTTGKIGSAKSAI